MARIRTIKPEFFKDPDLYDLEQEVGLPIRVAFAGLWGCCDREGRFVWKPRQLKVDILPHDLVDFSRVLDALATRGFVIKYEVDGQEYGLVRSFTKHQIINNRESASIIPAPPGVEPKNGEKEHACPTRAPRVPHACPTRAPRALRGKEGKGRERKGREIGKEGKGVGREGNPRADQPQSASATNAAGAQISSFDLSELLDRAGRVSKDGLQKMIEEAKGNPALSEKLFGIYNERFGPQRTETYDTMRKVGGLTR